MSNIIPLPRRTGGVPQTAFITACEALTWIGLGKSQTKEQLNDADLRFIRLWGHSDVEPVLRALEGRSAPAPFCVLDRNVQIRKGQPDHSGRYSDQTYSLFGPDGLRRIRARARQQTGRLVTYGELHAQLKMEAEDNRTASVRLGEARSQLLEALRCERISAYGHKSFLNGAPDKSSPYEAIPFTVFIEKGITVTSWNTAEPDRDLPMEAWVGRRGVHFGDVQFKTADILTLWPVGAPVAELVSIATDRTGASGRPTSKHLVLQEYQRRADGGKAEETIGEKGKALSDWLALAYPLLAQMAPRVVKNTIRREFNRRKRRTK